jgi:uncharacterized protein (DUF433 family)
MSKPATATPTYPHITANADGVPLITGTTMKVVELVTAHLAHGWSPEELHFQFPHLSLGQIHAALGYYWDHRDEIDADIDRRARYVEQLRREVGPSVIAAKLRRTSR